MTAVRRLLVVADADSYVKWGAALAARLPHGWKASLVIVASPVQPSERQLRSALAHTGFDPTDVLAIELGDLSNAVEHLAPHAVLLALRGPLVRLIAPIVGALPNRPVLLSGFPGLTIPAQLKAIIFREQVDLIVLHSTHEVRAFRGNAAALRVPVEFGLATLPFLHDTAAYPERERRDRATIVFAAQAKVPADRDDRVRLLGRLAETARAMPDTRVVIKVRAQGGEAQTHAEEFGYAELLSEADVVQAIGGVPQNLVVADGPMAAQLAAATGFVTISSTAVLEAIAAGVPSLLVDDFGVTPGLINTVFEGSGLLAGSDELVAGRFRTADADWLADNYFHGDEHDDWLAALEALVERREIAALPLRPRTHNLTGGALRRAFERRKLLGSHDRSLIGAVSVVAGVPARWAVRRVRRVRARFARAA